MQSVTVDGATYTKASVLAKKFNYTTDYIGQLCRTGKVDAQLVGRSWYVREDALLVHKDSRYRSLRENEITSNFNSESRSIPTSTFSEKVQVLPVLSKTTKRAVLAQHSDSNFLARMSTITPLRYESDEAELLPRPKAAVMPAPVTVPVNLAAAEKVKIRLVSPKVSNLEFTATPSVTLQGVLPISSYEVFPDAEVAPVTLPARIVQKEATRPPVPVVNKVAASVQRFSPASISTSEPVSTSGGGKLLLLSLALSCLIAAVIITFDSQVVYDGTVTSEKLIFNAASLGTVLSFFRF